MKNALSKTIVVPSFFWEDFLLESNADLKNNQHLLSGNRASNQARGIFERTNERITAIRQDPTSTDPQKQVKIEKITKSAKSDLERLINSVSMELAKSGSKLQNQIDEQISNTDRIQATETRQRLLNMTAQERSSFIRQLKDAGDFESISHILGRSATFLGIDKEEFAEIKQSYIENVHPEKATDLKALEIAQSNLKKGYKAVYEDFDSFKTAATEKSEAAKAALSG